MLHYRTIFRLPGGIELKARKGYVPDTFFEAIQNITISDFVTIYEGGFVLSNKMHDMLDIPGTYTSYASVGTIAPEGTEKTAEFKVAMLQKLKNANHARPLKENLHYQVFYMEHIDSPPDDD